MYLISVSAILSLFLGIGLAASSGFKVFLPVFLVSFLSFLGGDLIAIGEDFTWLKNPLILTIIGILAIVEIFIYFIPLIYNRMDKIKILLAILIGTLLVKATFISSGVSSGWIISCVFGGGIAGFFSYANAIARKITKITTKGAGNFLINWTEVGMALLLSITAIFISPLAFIITVILIFIMLIALNRLKKRVKRYDDQVITNVE